MKQRIMARWMACSLMVILGIGLSGCGGDGGGVSQGVHDALQAELEMVQGELEKSKADLETTTDERDQLQTQLDEANAQLNPQIDHEAQRVAEAIVGVRAGKQYTALNPLPVSDVNTRPDGGAAFSTGDVPTKGANKFTKSALSVAGLGDFEGSLYTRSNSEAKVDDEVTRYTDVDPNEDAKYEDFYSTGNAGMREGIDKITSNAGGKRNKLEFAMDVTEIAGRFDATAFPTGANVLLTYALDDPSTENVDEGGTGGAPTFSGSYHGIPGEYTCTGACAAQNDPDGNLKTLDGSWVFTPDAPPTGTSHTVKSAMPDTDYLVFGYWLEESTDKAGKITYEVGTFAYGKEPYDDNRYGGLEGTATYNGPAAGMYVKKSFPQEGNAVPTSSGAFTGDASLTAFFGGNDVAKNKQFTVDGTITDFRISAGDIIDSSWTAMLNPGSANDFGAGDSTFGGMTSGSGADGAWEGTFYGEPPADGATAVNKTDDYPMGMVGEFDAHFYNGHVIGAFGATR